MFFSLAQQELLQYNKYYYTFNMQNKYALDNIISILNQITKYQIHQAHQQEYIIKRDQLNTINDILTKNKQVLNSMNNGYYTQLDSRDYGNMSDLIQCYKAVTSQVNGYYNTNLYAKLGYKPKVTFWQKTKEVIKDAKIQAQLVKSLQSELENLKKQLNKWPTLKKQQIEAIRQMNTHLINGQLTEFKKKHTFTIRKAYNYQAKQYVTSEGYLLNYSINPEILQSISQQFIKLQALEKKLKQILQVKSNQYNQGLSFKKTIVERCTDYTEQIQKKNKIYREEFIKISKLEQIQKKIIMGQNLRSTVINYNYHGQTNTEQKTVAPIIEEYKIIKQVVDNLKKILNDPNWSNSALSLGQSCKYLVGSLQNQIREAADKLHTQIGSYSQGSVYTIGGLITLISSYKSIMQKKITNESISNKSPTEPKQNYGITLSHNNSLNKSASENETVKMDQLKLLNDIKAAGIIPQEFKKKYTNNIINKNRSYADQVIIAVLETTKVALQIPGKISLIDYITNLHKDKQYNEWMFASQQIKTQKLKNKIWLQQNNNQITNRNHHRINTPQGNQQQTQEQITNDLLKQNEKLNQQIQQLRIQIKTLDQRNAQLIKQSKQLYDQTIKNSNKITHLQDQIKQSNTLIQQLTSKIDEKNEQLKKLSNVSNMIASNSNSERDQIITRLSSQCQNHLERKQLYKSQCNLLNAQIGSVIQKANQIFKDKQLNSITQVFQRYLKQLKFLQERRQFYKLKCSQNQIILQQFFKKIQQKVENTIVDSLSDLQNHIQSLNKQKILCQKKLMENIQSLKSIQSILSKNLRHQASIQQNQTEPLSQQQKITKQILSKLNILFESNNKNKTIKFKDRSRILANTKEEKFIVQELINYLGDNSIIRFNLLYRYSQGGNLAEAITAHPNTVLIIKTNGVIIACYSSLSYCQTVDMKQRKGLLIQTHTNSSYCLKPGSKPVEYDDNNLIFGNNILKISKKERNHKIQIDFNQKNSVFENEKKHKIYDLFKSTDKQIQFDDFQLYQIQQKTNDTVIVQKTVSQSDPIRQSRIMQLTKAQERKQQSKTSVPKNNTSKGKVSIRELTQQVEKHKKGILVLKKQNEDLKKKLESFENAKVTDQKNKNTSGVINSPIRNTLTVPTGINRTTSNQSQQTELQKQMDQMTRKVKNTEQSLLQKTHKLNQAQNKIKEQEQKIKQLTKQRQATINQSPRKQKNDQLENVRKQKQQVQKKLLELEKELNKSKEQTIKNAQQLQKIRKQLQDTKSQIQNLKKQNQKTITELKEEKDKLIQQNQKLLRQQNIKKQQPRQIASIESNSLDNLGFNQQRQNFSNIKTNQSQQQKIIRFASRISQQSGTRSIIRTESGFNMNQAYIVKIKKQLQFMQKMFDYKIQPQTSTNTYNEIIQKLKTEINQLKQGLQNQKQQNNRKISGVEREKQKLQSIIKSNNTQLGEYYKKNQQLQKQIKKLKEGKSQLLQIPSTSINLQSPNKSKQSIDRSFNQKEYPKQLKKQVQENKKILNKIMESKNSIEKECTQKQADLFKINQKHKKASQNLKQLQDKVAKLKQEQQDIINLMGQLQAKKREKEQLVYQIKQIKDQIRILDKQINEKNTQIDRYKVQINNLKTQKQLIARQNKKMDQILSKIQQKKQQLDRVIEKLNEANINSDKIQQNIQLLKLKQQQQRKSTDLAIKDKEQINQTINNISSDLNNLQKQKLKYGGFPNRLFIGQTLSEELDREYIIQQVQKLYPRQKIANSRLLYAFPLMRIINPHQNVDGVSSYIIIMKLANKQPITKKNYILAMYSEKALIKGAPINNGIGFVSAVTKKSTFYIRNAPSMNPRLTQYNEFYFIFGNSQFRFRINSNKIQISVGHNFRSLDTGDLKTPELFAGTTQTDVQISSYQIYQLQFDRKY